MSKFKLWVEDDYLNNIQSYQTFDEDSQRQKGFIPGTPASSISMNTILRQSSLVTAALMDAIAPNDTTVDFRSSLTDMTAFILTQLKAVKTNESTAADNGIYHYHSNDSTISNSIQNEINAHTILPLMIIINKFSTTKQSGGTATVGGTYVLSKGYTSASYTSWSLSFTQTSLYSSSLTPYLSIQECSLSRGSNNNYYITFSEYISNADGWLSNDTSDTIKSKITSLDLYYIKL